MSVGERVPAVSPSTASPVHLVMVGASHHTADLGELERHVLTGPQRDALLPELFADGFVEVTVLATCSRTEVYALRPEAWGTAAGAVDAVRSAVRSVLGPGPAGDACRARTGDDAVAHLFRVAAGLDSRLVGERDVQPQVRDAGQAAVGASGPARLLPGLFRAATAGARRVHSDTAVGNVGRSLGTLAVERGLACTGPLVGRVLVLGSGCMARLVVEALVARDVEPLVIARDLAAAVRLTGDVTRVRPLERLDADLLDADLLVVATSADTKLVTGDAVLRVLRERRDRPLTIVDLAVPRNVDAAVGALAGVTLLDVAALHDASPVEDSWLDQVDAAERMTAKAARSYSQEQRARSAGPLLKDMRSELLVRCRAQLARATRGALDDEALDRAAHAVVGPVLHAPTVLVRAAAAAGDEQLLALLVRAFRGAEDRWPTDPDEFGSMTGPVVARAVPPGQRPPRS